MASPSTALVLEDDECDAAILRELLENCCQISFAVKRTNLLKEATRLLSREFFDFALIDMNLPDSKDLNTVKEIVLANPRVPVIVLTGNDDINIAIKALDIGAQDYLPKSQLDNRTLQRVIEYAIQRKEKETELSEKIHFDSLTGLANRSFLYERWRRCLARSKRAKGKVGLLIANVDRFSKVNERFGYETGDALLRDFSAKLNNAVRETDLVARLGGDEFILVLENIDSKAATDDVRKILLDRLKEPATLNGKSVGYAASVGVAVSDPQDEEDLMAVIKRADMESHEFKAGVMSAAEQNLRHRQH